ncbi:hypothetical protein HYT23_04140 [Candidatus Pacearchaeota archaeon]|nr:hypothetical protein [Candidatus Pacearchaeota archaeon]
MTGENIDEDKEFDEGFETSIEPGVKSKLLLLDEFDESKVAQEFRDFFASLHPEEKEARLYVYTPAHVGSLNSMGLFGDFSPSVIYSSNKHNETHLPFREKNLREFGYSKLCHLYCTLDKSIMFGFFNRHMAKSKVFNLNSAATILHRPDLVLDAKPLEDKEISPEEVVNILFAVKKNATKLLREVQTEYSRTYDSLEESHSFKYPKALEELLGDNLSRILLYGSSARGDGNDYDNLVAIKSLPDDFYTKIRGVKPNENGKDVGIIFVPENVLDKFLYINVSNSIFNEHSKPLKGDFHFPIESERYKIWKEMYHAGFGSAKLISGMNLVFREPEILFDKEGLFEYFMKLNRFTLHGLMQGGGRVMPSKEELLDILKDDFDYPIPEFRPDASYLQESFLKANKASVAISKKMYSSELAREPNEHLLVLESRRSGKIFTSSYRGKKVYVFGGREKMRKGDVVPARLLVSGEEGYYSRKNELHHRGIDSSDDFYIGRRL